MVSKMNLSMTFEGVHRRVMGLCDAALVGFLLGLRISSQILGIWQCWYEQEKILVSAIIPSNFKYFSCMFIIFVGL